MAATHKYYDLLGVSREASADDIRKAYKRSALQNHPDKGGDPEKFKQISAAYTVLSDDEKRREYDQLGDDAYAERMAGGGGGGPPGGAMNPEDLFAQMFGGAGFPFGGGMPFGGGAPAPNAPTRRSNHVHGMRISLAEAYHGLTKTIKVTLQKRCMKCQETCYTCQGRGLITDMRRMGFMTQVSQRPCNACGGTGQLAAAGKTGCGECGGRAQYTEDKKVEITIPQGVADRTAVVMAGLGEQPVRSGDIPGDLVLEIQVMPDTAFRRDGADLLMDVPMTFAESVLGKTVAVPHFGGAFDVDTLAEFGVVAPGEVTSYTIRGKGMPRGAAPGSGYGDLRLLFKITDYPKKQWTPEQREALAAALTVTGGAS